VIGLASKLLPGLSVLAIPLAVLSACSNDNPPSSASKATAPASEGVTVEARKVDGLKTVLVDSKGFTLYVLVPEKKTAFSAVQWTCTGECVKSWRPLTVPAGATPAPGHGLSASLLSSAKRPEGTVQVTYNGFPLYTFKGDNSPGEANGLDQRNGWYLISPSGAVGPPEK
jgi:predicted lipoprotein with Yx(FWY)xxD motif